MEVPEPWNAQAAWPAGKEEDVAKQTIKIGNRAPTFTLTDAQGNDVSLQDHLGKWVVLYFYPRDDTPGCTTEACEFSADVGQFEGLNATVVGVSPDSPQSHQKFITRHGLKVGLLSDPDHAVMNKYGAWGEKNMYGRKTEGVIRSTVLIDPEGRVRAHWPKVRAAGHAKAVADRLAELQAS